jgi:hypothetical protein
VDVDLVKGGNWGPKSVSSIKSMCDIVSVEGELTSCVVQNVRKKLLPGTNPTVL